MFCMRGGSKSIPSQFFNVLETYIINSLENGNPRAPKGGVAKSSKSWSLTIEHLSSTASQPDLNLRPELLADAAADVVPPLARLP